ncbi:MAG: acyl-CoA dehydrogenase family protein [Anaerovoracaceae bacterium]|jgi:alkylation response protein AidB-like acyl-CoA dehydrogenase
MAFILNEEQQSLLDMVDDFLTNELDPIVEEYDDKSEMPMQVLEQATEMGLHMLSAPESCGGMELDMMTVYAMEEQMGMHDAALTYTLMNTSTMFDSIVKAGTPEQREKYTKVVQDGGMLGFCLTETTGSSDAANMRTTAVKDGDDYIINGNKIFITSGSIAKAFVVFAVTDKEKGPHGISCFIVDADNPGLSVGKHENKLGLRMSPTNEIIFQDCRVPASMMLGPENKGFITAMIGLDTGRLTTSAIAMGITKRALKEAMKYTNERVVAGRPIYKNQYIAYTLAEYSARLDACEALLQNAVAAKESGASINKLAAECKLLSTDLAAEASCTAVQYFGGYGVCKDYPVEKLYRDAKILQIVEGANEVMRLVISRAMTKEYGVK